MKARITHMSTWPPENKGFYSAFRRWLKATGYGESAVELYSVAARLTLEVLDKRYWEIDLDRDLATVREHIRANYSSKGTRETYLKGVAKFEHYLRQRLDQPAPDPEPNWRFYLQGLPDWLAQDVKVFVQHRQRVWPAERVLENTRNLLSQITRPLRWMAANATLAKLTDIDARLWYAYVDARLEEGLKPRSVNTEWATLLSFIQHLQALERPVNARLLKVKPLDEEPRLPKDAPLEQVEKVYHEIAKEAQSKTPAVQRAGVMDRAWFKLMLLSGLRVGEIRRLKLTDIQWDRQVVRIEQSKGLKDRLVPVTPDTLESLEKWLKIRGPKAGLPEHVFVYRHRPLTASYCFARMRTYCGRCEVSISPHQLRHTAATLLLNAGAPVSTVQQVLGHKSIDTTLGYARLYDGTVAADYYRAMSQVEGRLLIPKGKSKSARVPTLGELIALVDSLTAGTLTERQADTAGHIRAGLVAMAEKAEATPKAK